ncbi:MAG: NUDIX domain-containing protein [archaeon]
MKTYNISVCIFYDKDKVLLQDRKNFNIIRFGEEYGFFGGGIKQGETPAQALKREIKEELNIEIKNYVFFKKYVQKFKEFDAIVERHVFIAPMPNIKNLKVDEGKPFVTQFKESFNLKMMPGDIDILKEIYQSYLDNP